jgi:hypothetical protein
MKNSPGKIPFSFSLLLALLLLGHSDASVIINSSMHSLLSCDSGTEKKNALCCPKCCYQHPWRLLGISYPSMIQLRLCASSFHFCGPSKKRNSPLNLGHEAAKEANNLENFLTCLSNTILEI